MPPAKDGAAFVGGVPPADGPGESRPHREGEIMGSPDRLLKRVQGVLLAALLCLVTAMPCLAQNSADQSPVIWFAPECRAWGSTDCMDLFNATAPWPQAASHVKIFAINEDILDHTPQSPLSDDQIRQLIADLKRRNMALAVSWSPLNGSPDPTYCGNGIEGFVGNALYIAKKVQELGGTLDYIVMDEPFQHARDACNWTPQQIAEQAAGNIAIIKTIFPNVKVGDTEVVPNINAPDWLTQYAAWLDAWRSAAGEPLAFFFADVNWGTFGRDTNYRPAVDAVRQAVGQRQIPFGIIYNGFGGSDQDWVNSARARYEAIEAAGAIIPDQVSFASWDLYPKHVLPESDPTTSTHLIDTYFRTRTTASAALSAGKVSGKLVDDRLNPIAGAPITVTAEPVSGSGIISSYTLTGTVPATITQALITVCVNECDQELGTNDMSVYSFAYSDSDHQEVLDFANGLGDWGVDPTGSASVRATSDPNGNAMQISATLNQRTYVNSAAFRVTPGSNYVLTVRARISPSSVGSGYFGTVFLVGAENSLAAILPFVPAKVVVGTTQTMGDGTYSLPYVLPTADPLKIQAEFPGDDALWPAIAVVGANLPATTIAAEYYYAAWDYYFETAFPEEIAGLDAGAYAGVWKRTGQTFNVWPTANNALAVSTCRFFTGTFFAPKSSHFYTPNASECDGLKATSQVWQFESIAFYVALVDGNGLCPFGTVSLYRMYNNGMGGAPNHRYTTSMAILNQMIAAGWVFEGNAVTKVFACVPQ